MIAALSSQLLYTVVGKFISLKGTVARVGAIKPLCTKLAFKCSACDSIFAVSLPDGRYSPPTACMLPGCQGHSFFPQRTHKLTTTVDWQRIRVQG